MTDSINELLEKRNRLGKSRGSEKTGRASAQFDGLGKGVLAYVKEKDPSKEKLPRQIRLNQT